MSERISRSPLAIRESLEELQRDIGYVFRERELLVRTLTHYSYVYETLPAGSPRTVLKDNEQLEFLGDAILGFIVSEYLLHHFPHESEGKLSERKSRLVSASYLVEVARRLEIGKYLFLGRGEELSGGREKKNLLADGLEALIAAVYLDGGIDAARTFIVSIILADSLANESFEATPRTDYKTTVQELARARGLPLPVYRVVAESGPGHAKVFTVEVEVGPEWRAAGEGSTKKGASQKAARLVYEKLTVTPADSLAMPPSP